jgi:hypothetical protein
MLFSLIAAQLGLDPTADFDRASDSDPELRKWPTSQSPAASLDRSSTEARPKYERAGQRYASDLADAEWAMIEPHMPVAKPLERPRDTDLWAVVKAILYMARTSCQWRLLPKDFPPFTTVQGYFYDWRDSGLFERFQPARHQPPIFTN